MIRHNRATAAVFGRCFLAMISVFALQRNLPAAPMVYTGLVVTDVRVGKTLMHNASLKITFEGDTDNILPVQVPSQECGGTPFYYLAKGDARMEIEFHGRTHTARLRDNQIFVALDVCNGGIGFGSFTGPNGLEAAYPLAFTLGTAEYSALNDLSPLTTVLTTTGSAWSCIGYPPLYLNDQTPGTSTHNCIPPDDPTSYPLKSDIGDIYVYQPYYEFDHVGATDIASNHSGSTNRGVFLVRPKTHSPFVTLGNSESSRTSGIVYTLQTVADGSIGGHRFNQALVTFQMISNNRSIKTQPSPVDPTKPLYENRAGDATVTIDDGGQVIAAEFEAGEVYVRYDTGAGIAGFGSRISATYPVALNCSDSAYPSDSSYTVDCLKGEAWNYFISEDEGFEFRSGILAQLSAPGVPSPGVGALSQSLSQDTLLTGPSHTCAGVYTLYSNALDLYPYFPGDLGVCGGPAPRGLHTSKGKLFLQDLVGGTNYLTYSVDNVPYVFEGGWSLANSGYLRVEVLKGDD